MLLTLAARSLRSLVSDNGEGSLSLLDLPAALAAARELLR